MAGEQRLTEDFELAQYVGALSASSNRIRYLIFAVAIATIIVLVSARHGHPDGWTMSRVKILREARAADIWDAKGNLAREAELHACAQEVQEGAPSWPLELRDRKDEIARISARHGFQGDCWRLNYVVSKLELTSRAAVTNWLDKIVQAQVSGAIVMNMPFLGAPFDVNDLGTFSGLTYTVLMVALWFSMVRHQENLYLSMWKVRDLAQQRDGPNPGGRANLLYHALAMSQLFTTPPTLARWKTGLTDSFPRVFFLIPALMHGYIWWNDRATFDRGSMVNERAAVVGWRIEIATLAVIILAGISCILHARACDRLWLKTFRLLNPDFDFKIQPSWLEWLRLKAKAQAPGWGIVATEVEGVRHLYVADFWAGKIWRAVNPGSGAAQCIARKSCRELGITPDHRLYGEHIPYKPGSKRWTYSRWSWSEGEGITDDSPVDRALPLGEGVLRDSLGNRYCVEGRGPGRVQILYRASKEGGEPVRIAGGRRGIRDGSADEAGFEWVQDITIAEDGNLYLTDGGCLREVTPQGRVTTIGGMPIGQERRYRRSRLLGIAVTREAFFVADYDRRHVWKIPRCGSVAERTPVQVWHAGWLWSPAGLAVAGDDLYILEHRPDTPLGWILRWSSPWSRVRKVSWRTPDAVPEEILAFAWF